MDFFQSIKEQVELEDEPRLCFSFYFFVFGPCVWWVSSGHIADSAFTRHSSKPQGPCVEQRITSGWCHCKASALLTVVSLWPTIHFYSGNLYSSLFIFYSVLGLNSTRCCFAFLPPGDCLWPELNNTMKLFFSTCFCEAKNRFRLRLYFVVQDMISRLWLLFFWQITNLRII